MHDVRLREETGEPRGNLSTNPAIEPRTFYTSGDRANHCAAHGHMKLNHITKSKVKVNFIVNQTLTRNAQLNIIALIQSH